MATITVVAASRGGQQQPLPHPDTLLPQQLCEWVIQRGRSDPGAWDYLRAGSTGLQRQSRRQETLSPQQLREWVIQRGCPSGGGYVPGGASESAAALVASASAATGASESAASADALHTITLDSGASRCFFRDCTTVTPLAALVPVSLTDPSGGPVVARASTILPCPAVPSGSLSGLHLPSFSTNLVSTAVLQDVWVDTFTPGGQRMAICQVAASSLVSASGQFATSCSCQVLSHQTLLWHHRLGHPSLPCLRSMHSRLLGLDYVASLVTESDSVCPPSVRGEPTLSSDVLEDRQFELECLATALPRFASMLLCPEGDPDALDIPTLRSYAEAIAGFSQRQGFDFFQTFSPTPKMTTLRVLLHVAAQRDYELQSLDFSTPFLQGSLHEEIWQRRPPGFVRNKRNE
ncbi:unnamed protein product [Closterium sp. NIES-53]